MAKSRFEYVKNYELPDTLMPNAYIVVRVDGRGFHKFSDAHNFEKPNDVAALDLMNHAARAVMDEFPDIVLAFGESDEFSFLMRRSSTVYSRRRSKINSAVASIFTSAYVFYWSKYFPNTPLKYPPTFDSRVVLYPAEKEVRDYFSWRQADTHINNLYNTCFWTLIHDGCTAREANQALQGTNSKDKNELLFARFGVNYNNLPAYFRKGSVLVRVDPHPKPVILAADPVETEAETETEGDKGESASSTDPTPARTPADTPTSATALTPSDPTPNSTTLPTSARPAAQASDLDDVLEPNPRSAAGSAMPAQPKKEKRRPYEGITGEIVVLHEDIIRNPFWRARPWLLS